MTPCMLLRLLMVLLRLVWLLLASRSGLKAASGLNWPVLLYLMYWQLQSVPLLRLAHLDLLMLLLQLLQWQVYCWLVLLYLLDGMRLQRQM